MDDYRRKFSAGDYKGTAKKAEKKEDGNALGQLRADQINFDAVVNKTQLVISSKQPGFYCEVCDKTFKDNNAFLEHINSKDHKIKKGVALGQQSHVTVQMVRDKLESLRKRKQQKFEYDFSERVKKQMERDVQERELKKQQRREKKRVMNAEDEVPQSDVDVAALMGFGQFGSSKR